jgi:hypothetical protein
MKANHGLTVLGALLTVVVLLNLVLPVFAATITSASLSGDRSSLSVVIRFDTSGLFGMGCLKYKITVKENKAFWPDKKLFENTYTSNVCYLGRYPNPVTFTQSVSISLGKGQHKLYAEVAVSTAMLMGAVTSWAKGKTNQITITVS